MNPRTVEYIVEEAFTGIRRNGLMAFASVSTIALSLGVLGAFVLAALSANNFAEEQLFQFKIVAFVDKSSGARLDSIVRAVRKMPGVAEVTARSREKEWASYKRQNPNIESAGLSPDSLPFALDVTPANPARTRNIAARVRLMKGIDRVNEGGQTHERVVALVRVTKGVSIAGALVLLVTTAFVISNAIRLTLYARRREIRIMLLMGATDQFVRLPLVIEGVAFGAAGAMVAWVLLHAGSTYIAHAMRRITPIVGEFTSGVQPVQLALGLLILGMAIGAIGSLVSIRRFLRD